MALDTDNGDEVDPRDDARDFARLGGARGLLVLARGLFVLARGLFVLARGLFVPPRGLCVLAGHMVRPALAGEIARSMRGGKCLPALAFGFATRCGRGDLGADEYGCSL